MDHMLLTINNNVNNKFNNEFNNEFNYITNHTPITLPITPPITPPITITTKAKFLCNVCDCVSIGNKGDKLTQAVFEKYGYANCYIERVATKKSVPGTLQIKGDGKKNRLLSICLYNLSWSPQISK